MALPLPLKIWMTTLVMMIIFMIGLGGLTRLTDSGLSMTDWRLLLGAIPPLNQQDWLDLFQRYQQTLQFEQVFPNMDLAGFKSIFWLEYLHRLWGRLIGLAFLIPMIVFAIKRKIPTRLWPHLLGLILLVGLQGLIGWWMVLSGLDNRIAVSPFRLMVHLGLALIILSWLVILLADDRCQTKLPLSDLAPVPQVWRMGVFALLVLIAACSGSLVAGMQAGLIYADWPLMAGRIIPEHILALNPVWRNLIENPATAQFVHRILGYLIVIYVLLLIPNYSKHGAVWLLLFTLVQITLGILALFNMVPIGLALPHQLNMVLLLISAIWFWRRLRYIHKLQA